MSTTGPGKPSSRSVAAALPPARPPPMITIGLPVVRSATHYILPPGASGGLPGSVESGGTDAADDGAAEAGPAAGRDARPHGLVGALDQELGRLASRGHGRALDDRAAQRHRRRPPGAGVGCLQ